MTGWAYKEIQQEDLKFPLVYGEGKRSRLLATIGKSKYHFSLEKILASQDHNVSFLYVSHDSASKRG